MPEKVQIGVRISEKQKEDWENYIEDSDEFVTMTGLVRKAVSEKINGGEKTQTEDSPGVASDVKELQEDINRIKKDVRWLRNNEQDTVDISEVAQEVYDELEVLGERQGSTPADQVVDETIAEASYSIELDDGEELPPQTIPALADRVGITEDECKAAIEHLQEQFLPVIEVELNNRTHYFREE